MFFQQKMFNLLINLTIKLYILLMNRLVFLFLVSRNVNN